MKNKLALIFGSASLAFTSTVLLAATSPAFAVDHGDNGGANYAGVEWDFAQQTSVTAEVCGKGPCTSLKPHFVVKATVRNDGKVCNEEKNFSDEALGFDGKAFLLCGQPAIITGMPVNTMRAYYRTPHGEQWVDSPVHAERNWLDLHDKHYWYSNW